FARVRSGRRMANVWRRARSRCTKTGSTLLAERRLAGRNRRVDVALGVRGGNERGLELRRRPVDAAREHRAMPSAEPFGVASFRVAPTANRAAAEEERQHRADALHAGARAGLLDRALEARLEPRAERLE